MSGLAVIFHRDGRPVDPTLAERMLAAAAYLGPDGQSIRSWGRIALGHARMRVTPEERDEQQPLVSSRTGCAIIADVRLDNRKELLARLPDRLSGDLSDADLILRAYEAWGADAITRLLGDFAFAIWDPRQQRLLCARDTSGQRPLFYRMDQHSFAAASEIQQLFQDPSVRVAPNENRIRDYLVPYNLTRNRADRADSFFDGIFAVAAGHALMVDIATHRVWRYWELTPPSEIRYRSDGDYAEHFRALFFEAVRARLRSSSPIGAMLSGGLDSSSIVCAAQELYRTGRAEDHGFTSFSVLFGGLECDEDTFIRSVPAKYGFEARYFPAARTVSSLQLAPSGFMPSPGATVSELDVMLRAATEFGVRVLLSGDVADSCVVGTPHVFDSLLKGRHVGDFLVRMRAYRQTSDESLRKILAVYCLVPLLPLWLRKPLNLAYARRGLARLQDRLVPPWITESLRLDLIQRNRTMVEEVERRQPFASPARQLDFRLLSPPDEAYLPAGWPVQIWRPFADRRLHEFLLAIPPEQKFAPHSYSDDYYAGGKLIVRRALRGILPEIIRARTEKTHFASLVVHEIKRDWVSYEAAFGPGGQSELAKRGYVDSVLLWSRLNRLREGEYGGDFVYIMYVIILETWLRSLCLPRSQLVTVPGPSDERQRLSGDDEPVRGNAVYLQDLGVATRQRTSQDEAAGASGSDGLPSGRR